MSVRIRCPECGASVRLADDRLDRKNYCPRCDARLPNRVGGGGGGSGVVLAVVLGLVLVGGLAVVGVGVAVYMFAGRAAPPPGPGPGPVVQVQPEPEEQEMRAVRPPQPPVVEDVPIPDLAPPVVDPPLRKVPELVVPPVGPPEVGPPPAPPVPPRPAVKEFRLPALPAPVDIKPAPVAEATDVNLPDPVEKAAVGGAGRFLILHLPKQRKLGVFDANAAKVERYIDLPEDKVFFAAGMSKLLVYFPTAQKVRRYDLVTGKQEAEKPFKVTGVNAFVLGHSSAGPLVVRGTDGARLYDVTTLAEIPLPDDPQDDRPFARAVPVAKALPFDGGEIWAGGNGRVYGNTGNFGMPNGVRVVSLEGGKVTMRSEHTSTWFVQPSPDGKYVFAGGHKPVTADLKQSPDLVESGLNGGGGNAASMYFPAAHGPYYLKVGSGGEDGAIRFPGRKGAGAGAGAAASTEVQVFLYGVNQPVAKVTVPNLGGGGGGGGNAWAVLQGMPTFITLVPRANLLVVRGSDKLRLIPVDLEKELEKSGIEFLVVWSAPPAHYKPGAEFRYPIKARSKAGGITYKVDSGPDGMKVAADGVLTWPAPAGLRDRVDVILSLKDKAGKEAFHTFAITPEEEGAAVAAKDPDPPVKDPEPAKPAKAGVRVPPAPPRPPIKPLALDERKTVSLPGPVGRAIPAGGGRFLVLHFPNQRKVGVFDVSAGEIKTWIDLAEDKPLLAAGMTKMVAYLPGVGLLQRFNLLTGEREASKKYDVAGVKALAMGGASGGPVAVAATDGGRFVDLDTLTEMKLPEDEAPPERFAPVAPGPKRLPFQGEQLWAAANGRLFVGSGGFNGSAVALEGDRVKVLQAHGEQWMYARPSPDAKYVFRGGTGAVTADGQKTTDVVHSDPGRNAFAGYFFLPAQDGPFYFHVHFGGGLKGYEPRFQKDPNRGVTVYMYGLDAPVARLVDLKDIPDWNGIGHDKLPLDEQVQLIPRAKVLVTLGPSRDKLTLTPLDLDAALDEAGIDFLLVTSAPPGSFAPGTEFKYPIRVRSKAGGVKYTLDSGPDGMKVGADGVVTWKVPAGFADADVSVIVSLKDAAKKEAFHTFRISKADKPEEYVPDPEPAAKPVPKADPNADGPRGAYRLPAEPKALDVEAPDVAARTEVPLPEKYDTVVRGGGGRFLVLHAKAGKKAFVFDVSTGAVARTVELGDDKAVLAAGMTQIVVYRPGANEIEKVNLLTGASEGKKAVPTKGVTELVMGEASAGPLFVRSPDRAELYDLETLLPMDLPKADGFPFDRGRVWASADGRAFANTASRATGTFVRLAVLTADSIKVTSELMTSPYAVPGPDGKVVYVAGYGELTPSFQPSNSYGRPLNEPGNAVYQFLPVPGGAFFLMVHAGQGPPRELVFQSNTTKGVTVWNREKRNALATLEDVPEMTADLAGDSALPSLVHFHPDAGVLVTVPARRDKVVVYPLRATGSGLPQKKPVAWKLPDVLPAAAVKATAPKEKTAVEIPGRIVKTAVGGGGRYLILQTDLRKLAVFDVTAGKIVRDVSTDDPIHGFGAGRDKLVLLETKALGQAAVLRRFDLATGKAEAMAGAGNDVRGLAIGSASAGPVIVAEHSRTVLYDLATLAPLKVPDDPLGKITLDPDRLAVTADGRTLVSAPNGVATGNRPRVVRLTPAGADVSNGEVGYLHTLAVAPDGKHIFLGGQGIFGPDFKPVEDVVWSPPDLNQNYALGLHFVPAAEGPYYLHVHVGNRPKEEKFRADPAFGLTVYQYGKDKPLGRLLDVPGQLRTTSEWFRALKPAGAVHFYPSSKLLVAVDPGMTKLLLVPLDPDNIPAVPEANPVKPKADPQPPKTTPQPPKSDPPVTPKTRPTPLPPPAAGKPFRLPPVPEPLAITPPPGGPQTFTFSEPASLSPGRVKPAGNGRFLLFQRHTQKVDVYDLNEGKVVRQVEFPVSSTSWVAGRTKLFVYDRDLKGVRRYDLLTGKQEAEKAHGRPLFPVAVGSATDGPVLCRESTRLRFLDGESLEPMDPPGAELSGVEFIARAVWAAPDGRTFGFGMGEVTAGPGIAMSTATVRVRPDGVSKEVGQFPSIYAVPDPAGRRLFAGGHGVYDLALKKVTDAVRSEDPSPREPPTHFYLPATDGPFYFRYHTTVAIPPGPGAPPPLPPMRPEPGKATESEVSVYAYGQTKPVAQVKVPDPLAGEPFLPTQFGRLPSHLFLIPSAKVLVVVPGRADKVHFVPLDLEAEMAKSGVEVPWVTSAPPRTYAANETATYPVKVSGKGGGLKYTLVDPAPGMALAPDGTFTWKVPADAPAEVRVEVQVKSAKGESTHAFVMTRK